jgi:hypothetical protein
MKLSLFMSFLLSLISVASLFTSIIIFLFFGLVPVFTEGAVVPTYWLAIPFFIIAAVCYELVERYGVKLEREKETTTE